MSRIFSLYSCDCELCQFYRANPHLEDHEIYAHFMARALAVLVLLTGAA